MPRTPAWPTGGRSLFRAALDFLVGMPYLALKQYRKLFRELDMPGGPAWVARYFGEEPGVGMTERAAVDDLCEKKPRLKGMRIERKR